MRHFSLLVLFLAWALSSLGQVYVNEILADNLTGLSDPEYGKNADWIEIYNAGSISLNLSGYYLSDDAVEPGKWVFPAGTLVEPGAYLLIWCDNKNSGLHTNFKLSKSGETVILSNPSLTVLDQIEFDVQTEDVSYGRLGDGAANWGQFISPSPGASNSSSGGLIAAKPVFSLESGFYDGSQVLQIFKQSPEAQVYYTLDGSIPTTNSAVFSSGINLDTTSVIRAIQIESGYESSVVNNLTVFVSETSELPVFSLITDPDNLFDEETGIYVKGKDYVWGWGNGNFWQDWEKPCHIQFWEADRKLEFSHGAGVKIAGALSRTASQKSLRLIARAEYGKTKFSHKFFKEKEISEFNEFVLRSSGNDWAKTMMADGMMATLVEGQLDIDYCAFRPAILFVNGQYWGIHNIREKVGDDYLAENHGVDKDNIDLISQSDDVREGDYFAYEELINFVRANDMSIEENFAFAEARMDMDEYLNYYMAQVYYANYDWPAGNIKFWRPKQENGKFRWILFDTDLAFTDYWRNSVAWVTDPDPFYEGSTDLFRKLMENEKFSTLFLERSQYHLGTSFSADRVISVIDSLQNQIEGEMNRHIARWYGHHGWTFTTADGVYLETPWLEDYTTWEANVNGFREFARKRMEVMNAALSGHYSTGNPVKLSFKVDSPEQGKIEMGSSWSISDSLDFYLLSEQSVQIRAIENYNSDFSHWSFQKGLEAGDTMNLVYPDDTWRYWDQGSYPGDDWKQRSFDDSNWPEGCATLGYANANICTELSFGSDASNKHLTYLFRLEFNVEDPASWKGLVVDLLRDDGAAVYLNGTQVVVSNLPDNFTFGSEATEGVSGDDELKYYGFPVSSDLLVEGINVLAVEVHQVNAESSDLSFNLGLKAIASEGEGTPEIYYSTQFPLTQIAYSGEITAHFIPKTELPQLFINEAMPVNTGFNKDADGYYRDWMEIYNPTDNPIDLGGLYLTDDYTKPNKWRIPTTQSQKTSVEAHGYLLVWIDNAPHLGANHASFSLNGAGEDLGLAYFDGSTYQWIDTLAYPDIQTDQSFGRQPDGADNWKVFIDDASPGSTNNASSSVLSGLFINEFMARNSSAYLNEQGMFDDWIEIYNSNASSVDIGGLFFTDNKQTQKLSMIPDDRPDKTTIPPKGFILVIPSARTELGPLHVDFQLAGAGEFIGLSQDYNGNMYYLDSLTYPPQSANVSYGRSKDADSNWVFFNSFTPGATNNSSSGVARIDYMNNLLVYPNPATGRIYLDGDLELDQVRSIQIISVLGKTHYHQNLKRGLAQWPFEISIEDLPTGIYYLVLGGLDGYKPKVFVKL